MNEENEVVLISDLYKLLQEFTDTLLEFVKAYDSETKKIKFVPPHPPEGKDCRGWHKKSEKLNIENFTADLKRNAFYNYSFSLFEIFTIKILKALISANEEVKNRYEKKWYKIIDEGFHKEFNLSSEILTDIKTLYERHDIVSRYEGSSYLDLIQSIIGLKKPNIEFYNKNISNFIIFKEIRNLLTHRGWNIDSIFCTTLKNNGVLKKNPKHLIDFLMRVRTDETDESVYDENSTYDLEHLIGSPLRIPLGAIAETLIYIAGYIVVSLDINQAFDEDENESHHSFSSYLHDLLNASKIVPEIAPYIVQSLFMTKEVLVEDKDKLNDLEIFNSVLAKDLLINSYEKSHIKSCTHCKESRDMLKKEIDYYLDVLGEDLHNILSAYIDNNLSKFIESLSNSEYKKYIDKDTFVSKKWASNKEFKKFLNSNN